MGTGRGGEGGKAVAVGYRISGWRAKGGKAGVGGTERCL